MNQYPAWKYMLIGIVLLVGLVYALPNLFGKDPALQVTSARGFAIAANLATVIDDALVSEKIGFKDQEQVGNSLLYRFDTVTATHTFDFEDLFFIRHRNHIWT